MELANHTFKYAIRDSGINITYGQVVNVWKKVIIGNPTLNRISTSIVKEYNNKIQQCLTRFSRKTDSFSKKIESFLLS